MSDHSPHPVDADVIVLLGTSWARLEDHNTRWRAVLQQWARHLSPGARLRVVDYPSFSLRNVRRPLAPPLASWDSRIGAVTGRLALAHRTSPIDTLAWRATARALNAALPPTGATRVVIAATPLWAPVMRHLNADRRGFDAVDDWRALPAVTNVAAHVARGYRAAAAADAATTVSPALTTRLARDFGIDAVTVANGVDLDQFTGARSLPPPGVPDGQFALYVGVVQQRVDAELLGAAAGVMPVVVAGPVHATMTAAVAGSGAIALGAVRSDTVPALLRAAAVALIPHHVDQLTTSMDPMKLREYLAAGLPVVTTIVPPPELRSERVAVATQPAAFASAVDAARHMIRLDGPDPSVTHRSWKTVADELYATHVGVA